MTQPSTEQTKAPGAQLLSVIIAARNEEAYIGACMKSLLAQDDTSGVVEVILAANACTDRTVEVATRFQPEFAARGWDLKIIEVPAPGKVNALNAGDDEAEGGVLVFLDADIRLDAEILGQLRATLQKIDPRYATGTLSVAPAKSWITQKYADFWVSLPFVKGGAVGAGLFAVNRAGRARWRAFPDIISDDTFVRLQFAPHERHEVPACYHWPMVEGFANLVRVRRRQDEGVREIYERYPELRARENKKALTLGQLLGLFAKKPISFSVYAFVGIVVRLRRSRSDWARGR